MQYAIIFYTKNAGNLRRPLQVTPRKSKWRFRTTLHKTFSRVDRHDVTIDDAEKHSILFERGENIFLSSMLRRMVWPPQIADWESFPRKHMGQENIREVIGCDYRFPRKYVFYGISPPDEIP